MIDGVFPCITYPFQAVVTHQCQSELRCTVVIDLIVPQIQLC